MDIWNRYHTAEDNFYTSEFLRRKCMYVEIGLEPTYIHIETYCLSLKVQLSFLELYKPNKSYLHDD